jgi:O-antigen ligase
MLMLTGGRTSFISLLLIFSFFILKYLQETKTRIKTWTFGLVIVMVLGMFVTNSIQFSNAWESASNDSWDRTKLWESAIQATPDMLLGVGTGDYKSVLNNFYLSHNLQEFADLNYNAHNQFIQILFSNGMLGLIALMLMLGRPLYLSVQHHNVLGTLTFFPFFIYAMTEVFLGRYQGVIFFAILHQAFVVHDQTSTPSFSLKISDF